MYFYGYAEKHWSIGVTRKAASFVLYAFIQVVSHSNIQCYSLVARPPKEGGPENKVCMKFLFIFK